MTKEERLEFCKICINRKLDFQKGMLCGITNDFAAFEGKCDDFEEDLKEKEYQLNLKLDAVDNDTISDGVIWNPRDFKKNKSNGALIFAIGLLVTFVTHAFATEIGFYIIAYGAVFTGGFLYLKGVEQEKVFNAHQKGRDPEDTA